MKNRSNREDHILLYCVRSLKMRTCKVVNKSWIRLKILIIGTHIYYNL